MMPEVIGLFYGSDTGTTEYVTELILKKLKRTVQISAYDIGEHGLSELDNYEFLILGLSTWFDGDLQSDWEGLFDTFKRIKFSGKKVAIYGVGDQIGYGEFFVDGIGILGKIVVENGGEIIGLWSTKGYDFEASEAEFLPGWFMGLAIDEDNQGEMTEQRVEQWVNQILEEFSGKREKREVVQVLETKNK